MIQNQPNQEAFESPRSGSSGEFAMDSHVSHVENQTNLQECGELVLVQLLLSGPVRYTQWVF